MSASEVVAELTVADTGYLNNWVFMSRKFGLVGTRDVPLLMLDLEGEERFAAVLASTGTMENQGYREAEHYLQIDIGIKRSGNYCVRLPLPEMEQFVGEVLDQRCVALADFDNWASDVPSAVLLTFE